MWPGVTTRRIDANGIGERLGLPRLKDLSPAGERSPVGVIRVQINSRYEGCLGTGNRTAAALWAKAGARAASTEYPANERAVRHWCPRSR